MGSGVRVMRARQVAPPTALEQRALRAQLAVVDSTRQAKATKTTKTEKKKPAKPAPDSTKRPRQLPLVPASAVNGSAGTPGTKEVTVQGAKLPAAKGRIDMDVASAAQIQALPGIGPSLAKRIVANRDSNGAFGSLAQLQRVRGIGPLIATRLDSLVSFSGTPRAVTADPGGASDFSALKHKPKPPGPP